MFERFRDEPGTQGWTVLHSQGLARRGEAPYGEIDFVVLIPGSGVFCIEVKGGGVRRREGVWETSGHHGTSRLKQSPFMQARKAMFALRDSLQARSASALPLDRVTIGYAVMFPDVVFREADPEWERWQVIDRDALHHQLTMIFQRLSVEQRKLLHIHASETEPARATTSELVRLIRPDFEVVVSRGAEIEQTEERLLRLTEEQYAALDIVEDNSRCLFQGAAGTGKTMLALEAARRAARAGHRTLFLCYNALLGDWIEQRVREDDCGGRLAGRHFHQLLLEIIGRSTHAGALRAEKAKSAGEKFFMETLPFFGQLAIEELGERIEILVIDEAQDLLVPPVLDVLDTWLAGGLADGRWVIFGDFHRQAIFNNETGATMIGRLEERCPFFARASLKTNCRNTRHIGDVTALLAGFPTPPYRVGTVDGIAVDRREYNTDEEQCTTLREVIRSLLRGGVRAGDITVLSPRKLENSGVAAASGNDEFRFLPVTTPAPERSRLPVIRFATVQRFKGMESPVVIMCDIEALGDENPQRLLYTGLSRARSHLTVLLHRNILPAYKACIARSISQSFNPSPSI
jgi:UvrD-like helicase C-terminal domain/Nuclease-related domain/Type III restriction enzyme, res subunit